MKEIQSIQKKIDNKQPSNIEAEQALIGSVLVNNDIIDEISSIISSSTFYDPAHTKIYEVISKMGLDSSGYRLITNDGSDANQEVPHFHVHIFGGENLGGLRKIN